MLPVAPPDMFSNKLVLLLNLIPNVFKYVLLDILVGNACKVFFITCFACIFIIYQTKKIYLFIVFFVSFIFGGT